MYATALKSCGFLSQTYINPIINHSPILSFSKISIQDNLFLL